MVTSGMYTYLRHPGYFGWFLWSVGTQVLLCNPICAVAFAVVVRCTLFWRNRARYQSIRMHTLAWFTRVCMYVCVFHDASVNTAARVQVCRFFQKRVPAEERTLLCLFGSDYEEYASRTPIRIPFVSGLIPVKP